MSVSKENRPENRFEILAKFDDAFNHIASVLKTNINSEDALVKKITNRVFGDLIDARRQIIAFNEIDVYEDHSYVRRVEMQDKAVSTLADMNSIFQTFTVIMNLTTEERVEFSTIIDRINKIMKSIHNLKASDSNRHTLGHNNVIAKFKEAKHKQFYEEKTYDHTKNSEHDINDKCDPFGVASMIFDKKIF